MVIKWRALPFTHQASDGSGCGKEASILEIAVSSDGALCVSGVCIQCGEQFSSPEMPWAVIMRSVSIKDFKESLSIADQQMEQLIQFEFFGKPC
jgi:hypothetical protein